MTYHFLNTHNVGCHARCLMHTTSLSLHGSILQMRKLELSEVLSPAFLSQ